MGLLSMQNAMVMAAPHIESTSGDLATFTTNFPARLNSCVVGIVPVQSGSGDPSPDNVRPITGWTNCTVNHGMPITPTLTTGYRLDSSTGGLISTSSYKYSDYISVDASTTMRVSYHMPSGAWYFTACYYDSANSFISSYQKSHSADYDFTESLSIPATCAYVRFSLKFSYTNLAVYENFTAKTIQFPDPPGTVYGGTLDVTTGVLTVKRRLITLENANAGWNRSTSYPGGFYKVASAYSLATKTPFICSHAKTVTSTNDYVYGTCYCDNSLNIRIMPSGSTLDDWKNYVETQYANGTPVTICGYLASPVTYQLTPQEVNALKGQNNIWSDSGAVAIKYWNH